MTFDQPHLAASALNCDVLVAGGGLSGVCCALSAARNGARVILCQDRPVLGGNASSEIRMHVVGANSMRPCADLELEARETGIVEEIRLENAVRNAQRSPSMFDQILYEKCVAEPNLRVMLNTTVAGVAKSGRRLTAVQAWRLSTEEKFTITASVFVDCTGDSGLAAAAGAAHLEGREAKAQFGESLAQDTADHKRLGSTILFMARKHDRPMPFTPPPWARKFTEEQLKLRPHATGDVDYGLEYGFWWLEWGGQFDTIRENPKVHHELLAIVMGIWDHVKNGGDHCADNWALDWFGAVPGKRESRRLLGRHVLTERDVMESTAQPDAIAYGGWPIDLHPPEGVDRPDEEPCAQHPVPWLYDIPLRCCVARDFDNLMFAGRNLSATHVAFASTRVMATCGVVGEGVGVTAALAVRDGTTPGAMVDSPAAIAQVQQQLLRQDAWLIGRTLDDSGDLTRTATITASSSAPNGSPENVRSGVNRTVTGPRGVKPERELPGTHRWISDPAAGLPAWIELRWPEPQPVSCVELVFDTGLHRHLTLTQSDAYCAKMCWGQGQPETVKDYELLVERAGEWTAVASMQGNWQRRVQQLISGGAITSVRLRVLATWGGADARVMRLSAYAA
jgi:ribulose 1,5-bisphosphate synthetase/thiazole synthase